MAGSALDALSVGSLPAPLDSLLRSLWRSRRLILILVALGAACGVGYCLLAPVSYKASSTLLIEAKDAEIVQIDKVYDPSSAVREYHRTQYELLQSRELIDAVVRKLDLLKDPAYSKFELGPDGRIQKARLMRVFNWFRSSLPSIYETFGMEGLRLKGRTLTDEVIDDLRIDPVPNTYLVKVTFSSKDPALSARVANAVVDQYLTRERAARTGLGYEAAELLTQRVEESRLALQRSELALQKFLEREDLINVGGVRGLVEDEISERTRRLREAKVQRSEMANVYARIKAAGENVEALQDIPLIQEDPLVRDTKTSYLTAKQALEEILPRYGERHPTRIAAQARYDAAERAYVTQLKIRAQGIRNDYQLAAATESDLQAGVNQSTARIQNLDRKDYELKVLQRDVDSNRDLYQTFLKRYKETRATADLELGNARVIDRAVPPLKPSWPRPTLILIGSCVLGFMLACMLILLRVLLDNTVSTFEDLEALIGVPALCALPHIEAGSETGVLSNQEMRNPKSIYAEGIRTLRTSVLLQDSGGERMKKIMVCSSMPADGKSSIASNLALCLAERERVLLVDVDLRKPRIATLFELDGKRPGMIQLLSGEASLDEVVRPAGEGRPLDVLPAGILLDNPQVLLASDRLRSLIADLATRYDRIIFDTAPCPLVSDALLFANQMDGVILVGRAGKTVRRVLTSAARALSQAQAPVIGGVLNDVDPRHGPSEEGGYYYRYGYYG